MFIKVIFFRNQCSLMNKESSSSGSVGMGSWRWSWGWRLAHCCSVSDANPLLEVGPGAGLAVRTDLTLKCAQ